jgi:hypothetical protein
MAWNYRKRIKIIPGVHLNLSKRGISTNIGVRGANVTIGSSGSHLNISLPGTGISSRTRLSTESANHNSAPNPGNAHGAGDENIFSADIQEITSQNMQGVKEAILLSQSQRKELGTDLNKIKASLVGTRLELAASYVFLYGLIKKGLRDRIKADLITKKDAIQQIQNQIEQCYVELDIQFDEEMRMKYDRVTVAFKKLVSAQKIWDVTNAVAEDKRVTRSAASVVVKKSEVRFGNKPIADIRTPNEPMWLQNANGGDLYIYPNFIVMHSSKSQFAIVGLDELEFVHGNVRFVETGVVPKDAKVVGQTWAKVNANGTPDKRFKENYQIPVVLYGHFSLRTNTGLMEDYQFSNSDFAEEFGSAFASYQGTVKALRKI